MSSYSIQLLVAAVIVPSTLFLTQHEVLLTLLENTGFTASYKRIPVKLLCTTHTASFHEIVRANNYQEKL